MAKLPKSIIRKYGITKKAWSVFRGNKATTRKTGVKTMARRKHSSSGRSRFLSGGLMKAPIKTDGMIADAIKGLGGAEVSDAIPFNLQLGPISKRMIAGYLVGGVVGLGAVYIKDNVLSSSGSSLAVNSSGIVLN